MKKEKNDAPHGNEGASRKFNGDNNSISKDTGNGAEFQSQEHLLNTPLIEEDIYELLPRLLKDSCRYFKNPRERDVYLTSSLVVLSGCMDSLKGLYYGQEISSNLFAFIVAPPASGKGSMKYARSLGAGIHKKRIDEFSKKYRDYKIEFQRFKKSTSQEAIPPDKPPTSLLFVPGNSSDRKFTQFLEDASGRSIVICESEADTLIANMSQNWGMNSYVLRNAFHHETISLSRMTDDTHIEIQLPRLSCCLTGTPSQLSGLMDSVENGLFSRFIYYIYKPNVKWNSPSPRNINNLTSVFSEVSNEVEKMHYFLKSNSYHFNLTEEQWGILDKEFDKYLKTTSSFIDEALNGSVYRLGLILYRICMVLTGIRIYEERIPDSSIICNDDDFQVAMELTSTYLKHAIIVFDELSHTPAPVISDTKKRFLKEFPIGQEVTRAEANEIGQKIGISPRTVHDYLSSLHPFIVRTKFGHFRRVT